MAHFFWQWDAGKSAERKSAWGFHGKGMMRDSFAAAGGGLRSVTGNSSAHYTFIVEITQGSRRKKRKKGNPDEISDSRGSIIAEAGLNEERNNEMILHKEHGVRP